jgi:hypothetical protein
MRIARRIVVLLAALGGVFAAVLRLHAADTNAPERIGVYDSRIVAYAWFWSEPNQSKLADMMNQVRQALAAGDRERGNALGASLKAAHRQNQLETYGSAPAVEAMAALKDRLEAIEKKANVSVLISKWDPAALTAHKDAAQVEVTDALMREFHPGPKQLGVIAHLRHSKPGDSNIQPNHP